MVRAPIGPSPISVPPELTVWAELADDPLTDKVPLLTVVDPL